MSEDEPSTVDFIPKPPPVDDITDTPTGGAAIRLDYSPSRKSRDVPNEDFHSVRHVALDAGEDPAQKLHRVVQHVGDRNVARKDGTTITSALLVDGHLYTSHMGDSPVLVITYDPANKEKPVSVRQVTRDHTCRDEEEVKLLPHPENVFPGDKRLYTSDVHMGNGLMLSRGGGLTEYELNRAVEDTHTDLNPELASGKKVYVVVGSDGMLETVNVAKIEKLLNEVFIFSQEEMKRPPNEKEIVLALSKYRYSESFKDIQEYRRDDDTTVIVQPVEKQPAQAAGRRQGVLMTVADGNGFQFEQDHDVFILDDKGQRKPHYEKPLAQVFVEEVDRYMDAPNLIRDAVTEKKA